MVIGILQGSIFVPLLFNNYINDISLLPINGNLKLFADDCVIFYLSKSVVDVVRKRNENLDVLANYYYLNKITLNAFKTKYVIFNAVKKIIHTRQKSIIAG
jgi:hypothetical protein